MNHFILLSGTEGGPTIPVWPLYLMVFLLVVFYGLTKLIQKKKQNIDSHAQGKELRDGAQNRDLKTKRAEESNKTASAHGPVIPFHLLNQEKHKALANKTEKINQLIDELEDLRFRYGTNDLSSELSTFTPELVQKIKEKDIREEMILRQLKEAILEQEEALIELQSKDALWQDATFEDR